jgi:hypothetical protein
LGKEKLLMSSSDLIRWSGLAAMVAGALWAVGAFFDLMYFSPEPMSEVVPTGSFLFQQVLYLLGATLLLIGLVGLYARQSQAAGALGLVGFLIAFAATVLAAGSFWAGMFIAPALATEAPEFLDAGSPPGLVLTLIGLGVGWLVFGIATLRAGVYPRRAAILVIVGAVIVALPLPFTIIVLSVAVGWLGFHLFTGREAGEARTSPRVS